MKKYIFIFLASLFFYGSSFSQYFQGSWVKNPSTSASILTFRIKPTGTLTTAISYLEFAFRYPNSGTPSFTVTNITSNTTNFPGLAIQRFTPDFNDGTYTYVKFVHNTATVPSATYTTSANGGNGYDIFEITISGPAATISQLDMASNLVSGNYQFGVVDGAGNQIDPGAGPQLYGPGYNTNGNDHLVPLTNVPVPVRFSGFTATKKDNSALLNWSVENESSLTDRYEVERSANGIDFIKIASVAPKGNGGSNNYDFTNFNLSSFKSSGVIYYRIKQFDKDGKYIYSEIRAVRLDGKGISIAVYPNPIKDVANVTLDLIEAAPVAIFITDAAGKEIQRIQLQGNKGTNIQKINMTSLASGTYLIKVSAGGEIKTLSVVKAQ